MQLMELRAQISAILQQARTEIQANMANKGINASGRTSRAFRVEDYAGGIRLVLAHEDFVNIPCEPKGNGSVQVGVAPLETLEVGHAGGSVPKGFYYIIKQWTRDKGIQFGKESERQTFAYFLSRRIARNGTRRHSQPVEVYSEPVKKAQTQIRNDIRTAISTAIMNAAKTNF